MKDIDFLLAGGELFALVVYAQLILENAAHLRHRATTLVDQIFDFMVRDFSEFALQLYSKPSSTAAADGVLPADDPQAGARRARYDRVWDEHVLALKGAYEMNA